MYISEEYISNFWAEFCNLKAFFLEYFYRIGESFYDTYFIEVFFLFIFVLLLEIVLEVVWAVN